MFPQTAERRLRLNETSELRDISGKKVFYGNAAVYGEWSSKVHGYFKERLAAGCFQRSLGDGTDIVATVDHDINRILGRRSANTLRLADTNEQLAVECDASDYTWAKDLQIALERKDIRGMSFIFDVRSDEWTRSDDGTPLRTVLEANLYEVSFVHFPVYPQSEAGLRGTPLALPLDGEKRAIERAKRVGNHQRDRNRLRLAESM